MGQVRKTVTPCFILSCLITIPLWHNKVIDFLKIKYCFLHFEIFRYKLNSTPGWVIRVSPKFNSCSAFVSTC